MAATELWCCGRALGFLGIRQTNPELNRIKSTAFGVSADGGVYEWRSVG